MNASAIGPAVRAMGLALVIVAAAAFGLLVGNAIQGRSDTNFGYPQGWQGGAAVPVSRTATATFSIDALEAVRAARGDKAAAAEDYVDYAQRHASAEAAAANNAEDYLDYAQRHATAEPAAQPSTESLAKPTVR